MDETYIKIKGQWKHLYRAVDTDGQTIDFLLTARRDSASLCHNKTPVAIVCQITYSEYAFDLLRCPDSFLMKIYPVVNGFSGNISI